MTAMRWSLLSLFLLIAATLMAALLTPTLREKIQDHLISSHREILAAAEGDLLNNSSSVKVIKYRSREGIFLEILKMNGNDSDLIERLALPDKHDGLFNFQGHVTRLAIADIDQDGTNELLAPTFDNQLVPHLNVFKFNAATNRFEPVQPGPK